MSSKSTFRCASRLLAIAAVLAACGGTDDPASRESSGSRSDAPSESYDAPSDSYLVTLFEGDAETGPGSFKGGEVVVGAEAVTQGLAFLEEGLRSRYAEIGGVFDGHCFMVANEDGEGFRQQTYCGPIQFSTGEVRWIGLPLGFYREDDEIVSLEIANQLTQMRAESGPPSAELAARLVRPDGTRPVLVDPPFGSADPEAYVGHWTITDLDTDGSGFTGVAVGGFEVGQQLIAVEVGDGQAVFEIEDGVCPDIDGDRISFSLDQDGTRVWRLRIGPPCTGDVYTSSVRLDDGDRLMVCWRGNVRMVGSGCATLSKDGSPADGSSAPSSDDGQSPAGTTGETGESAATADGLPTDLPPAPPPLPRELDDGTGEDATAETPERDSASEAAGSINVDCDDIVDTYAAFADVDVDQVDERRQATARQDEIGQPAGGCILGSQSLRVGVSALLRSHIPIGETTNAMSQLQGFESAVSMSANPGADAAVAWMVAPGVPVVIARRGTIEANVSPAFDWPDQFTSDQLLDYAITLLDMLEDRQ